MIIKYSDTNENRIKWQHREGEEWKTAELHELIEAYERATEPGDLISREATIQAKEYEKCFAYQLWGYDLCRGASGQKFWDLCVYCPCWLSYKDWLFHRRKGEQNG